MGLVMCCLDESTQQANLAGSYVGILKKAIYQDLLKWNAPLVVWDYCVELRATVHNLTAKDKSDMSNMNPFTWITGNVADILSMCVHKLYGMMQYSFSTIQAWQIPWPMF